MKTYLLIMTIIASPMAFAGTATFGADAPPAEEAKAPEPKPEQKPEAPVEAKPAVDKWADVRCSAGKYTNLGTGSGPSANDADDIVTGIFGIPGALNRLIIQTSKPKQGEQPGKFGITHREGRLQIGLPGKGAFGATVFLPAKMCLKDDDKTVVAYIDASGVAFGPREPIPLTIVKGGEGSVIISGSADGSAPLSGTFGMTTEALK